MSGVVDWELAVGIARRGAGGDRCPPPPGDLAAEADAAELAVRDYTGLEPLEPVPPIEWVGRATWAEAAIGGLRASLEPLEERLLGPGLPGPVDGVARAAFGRLAGVQIGGLIALASRAVLGQYEFPVLDPGGPARLLLVAPNVLQAGERLGGEPLPVLRWIALHEVTHAVHLQAVPWLRAELASQAGELLTESSFGPSPGELARALRGVIGRDPRRTLAEVRSSDPLTLLAPPATRRLLERTQATMALIEGYAEHVMDGAAPLLGEDVRGLRAAMDRRRAERSPLARLLHWLLGLDLKLRQYRDGRRFADRVVAADGVEALNRAWREPAALPSQNELADPASWLRRTDLISVS